MVVLILNDVVFFFKVGDVKNVGLEFDFVFFDNYWKFSDVLMNVNFVDVG